MAQLVKTLPARWETWIRSLGWDVCLILASLISKVPCNYGMFYYDSVHKNCFFFFLLVLDFKRKVIKVLTVYLKATDTMRK